MSYIIKANNISKKFSVNGRRLEVLSDISLVVKPGEFLCLIGPSGSGKSTFLRILLDLIKPTSGNIEQPANLKSALVFQNFAIFPWLTTAENVGFGLAMSGLKDNRIHREIAKYIKLMELEGFENSHPKELSGGMKQRVGIARALAVKPDILFMDEPFSSLDAITAAKLRQDLLSVWQSSKMTVVMVTHLVEEAVEMADRIAVFGSQPAHIEKVIDVKLPRPRNKRHPEFYGYVDNLLNLVA